MRRAENEHTDEKREDESAHASSDPTHYSSEDVLFLFFFPQGKFTKQPMWDEVWETTPSVPAPDVPTPAISARAASADPADGSADGTFPSPEVQLLLDEIHELRREHARRSTMQLVLTCILFALLMHHLDRPRDRRG